MPGVAKTARRLACLGGILGVLILPLEAAARSKLSRWVFDEAAPAIERLLDEALASALRAALVRGEVPLYRPVAEPAASDPHHSLHELDCSAAPAADYRLLLSARPQGRTAEVLLTLIDSREPETAQPQRLRDRQRLRQGELHPPRLHQLAQDPRTRLPRRARPDSARRGR